jgi:hypothetical protein
VAAVPLTVYEIDPEPPVALKVILPFAPKHPAGEGLAESIIKLGSVIVKLDVDVHPFTSVATMI